MKTVRPKPLTLPPPTLPLTAEEGFVLSRIDGSLSLHDLVALTGIDEARVEQIVTKLADHGAVSLEDGPASVPELEAERETASLADFAAALGLDPTPFVHDEDAPSSRSEARSNYPPPATSPPDDVAPASSGPLSTRSSPPSSSSGDPVSYDGAVQEPEPSDGDEDEENGAENVLDHRRVYEARFRPLDPEARIAAAKTLSGADLCALCFDQDPRIVAAILDNPRAGFAEARLLAAHHRTSTGLELLSRKTALLRDGLCARRLLRNAQCGDVVLGRLVQEKHVTALYRLAIDREIPELLRIKLRGHLKNKFQTASAEDRADLVTRTEARCLALLTGCTFDARMTAILCGRSYNSVLFIQNLARFSATPPPLLAHLLKQPFVKRMMPLKKLLLAHPNVPGEAKRQA